MTSPLDPIFAAFDISTAATAVGTALVAIVGVRLLFVGFKYVKSIMGKA